MAGHNSWFIKSTGETIGPLTDARVRALVSQGRIDGTAMAGRSPRGPWKPLHTQLSLEKVVEVSADTAGPIPVAELVVPEEIVVAEAEVHARNLFPAGSYALIGAVTAVCMLLTFLIVLYAASVFEEPSAEAIAGNSSGARPNDQDALDQFSAATASENSSDPDGYSTDTATAELSSTAAARPRAPTLAGVPIDPVVSGRVEAGSGRALTTLQGKEAQRLAAQAIGNVIIGWDIINEDGDEIERAKPLPHFVSQDEAQRLEDSGANVYSFTDDDGDVRHCELLLGGSGTCFLVTSDGYALTNNHVVEDFDEVSHNRRQVETVRMRCGYQKLKPALWVILNGHPYRAKLIYRSDTRDYAILKIPVTDVPFFRLSTDEEPARLTEVMALGFPGAARNALSDADARDIGRRDRQARKIASSPLVEHDYVLTDGKVTSIAARSDARWIQHNAAISPGNSGGPLVDANCVVLGINTQLAVDAQGTFFALQLKQIRSRIERYVSNTTWR